LRRFRRAARGNFVAETKGVVALPLSLSVLPCWQSRPQKLDWRRLRQPVQPNSGKAMLVVLPFENLSGDPGQEYLSDGITEELSAQLGNLVCSTWA